MLKDLKQYIIDSITHTGQGALWKSFLMHSSYTEYLTTVLDGFLKNYDQLEHGTPDLLCSVGHNWHIDDYSGIEGNPYEDPDLIDLIVDCIDPDRKGGYYGSYETSYFADEFCLNANMEISHERKVVEDFVSYLGFEGGAEKFLEILSKTPKDKWEEIDDELSLDYGGCVDFWRIQPSTPEKATKLQEIFVNFPLEYTDGVFWNFTVTYDGEAYSDFDYDKDRLAELLELYSPNTNDIQVDKYKKVFDVFSTSGYNFPLLIELEKKSYNRKDVLF